MDSGNNFGMKIIDETFNFFINSSSFNTKKEMDITDFITQSFPSKFEILINKNNIFCDLEGNFYNTKVRSLTWQNFSNEFLLEIRKYFGINIRKACNINNDKDNLIGYYKGKNLKIALKTEGDRNYLIIYWLDLPDLYRGAGVFEGSLYVHGIWEVELSNEFKHILFGESI